MLIEELIRMGRPLLDEGGLDVDELLHVVTDACDVRAKNYYRHVYVIELTPEGETAMPQVLPMQIWGAQQKDDFLPDVEKALCAPMIIPGGNPTNAQGRYGIPVFPLYKSQRDAFCESPDKAADYLAKRLDRAVGWTLSQSELTASARLLSARLLEDRVEADREWLGVFVLVRVTPDGPFEYTQAPTPLERRRAIGRSQLRQGSLIITDRSRALNGQWSARVAEATEKGRRLGICFITGQEGEVVAPYCTAWPWAFLTWKCPLPHGGSTELLTEGVGLSNGAYRALTLGACAFRKLTQPVQYWLLHELFGSVGDRSPQNSGRNRSLTKLTPIYGAAFVLPVQDSTLADPEHRAEFVAGMRHMLGVTRSEEVTAAGRHLDSVTGFDSFLPPDLDRDDYRLTVVYFSGDVSRGDVHMRAYIRDVLPSVAKQLDDLAGRCADTGRRLLLATNRKASDKQVVYLRTTYRSVPYILARAYGGPHLWAQLEAAMHRRRLERGRITANAAARLASLVPNWPDSRFDVNDEVIFYLTALEFAAAHNFEVAGQPGDDMPMRPWPELLDAVERGPIQDMNLRADGPAEVGFACGVVTRQFAKRYWSATKVGEKGKDFLEHRVLTFGSDLSPLGVRNGLRLALELPNRLRDLYSPDDFERRVGVLLHELDNRQKHIIADRDSFLAAFWAGYALQGANAPEKPADQPVTVTATTEEQQ